MIKEQQEVEIFLAKQHQIGTYKNVVTCKKYPLKVKKELKAYMEEKKTQKVASYDCPLEFVEVKALGDDVDEDDAAQ